MSSRQRKLPIKLDLNIDNELFIEEVRNNECLYNAEHAEYKNLAGKAKIWKEIAKKFRSRGNERHPIYFLI